jgi:2-iminobutanoate/2-iminopropanoate deaminase
MKRLVKDAPAPMGAYSAAVSVDGLIYVSGTLPRDATGDVAFPDDVAAQTRHIARSIGELLSNVGSSLEHVVAVTVYLKAAADFQIMNDAYRTCWRSDLPTRTTIITDLLLPGARVEMSMIAVPSGSERVVVHPDAWLQSPSPYSYAIRSGDLVFLSGVVSRSATENAVVAGDLATQSRVVLDNAAALLAAANLSLAAVVSNRVFIVDAAHFEAMNAIYHEYFPADPPARATVVSGLAGSQYLIEMTMIAAAGLRRVFGDAPPRVPISQAVRAGRWLYVSGVLGHTPATTGDVASQTREALARIASTLRAAGALPSDVVDSLVYLRDVSLYAAMDAEYRKFFGTEFPARTTVATPLVPPDALVEIMVTACTE